MNKYTLKDPTAHGRDYLVEPFNLAFNMNITYGIFKNKLDEFKKSYKMWKFLMKSTATPEWWDNHEAGCREMPKFWDIMVRCFALHDVYSQPQHSARQRRQEIMNERRADDSTHWCSDFDGNEKLDTEVPNTQENEEVYRVNLDDDSHPSNEFTHDAVRINIGRGEQRGRHGSSSHSSGRRGGSLHRSGGSSGTNVGSDSRGSRRKQSFETTMQETITGFRDFQRQSLQQLLPGAFD
ncbi:hypothetical protein IGI04_023820 [Brassica rapa subsp. trilocularis]|uniref:Myb/SANT-like domain-containing protein n=1 Tax=Brassica rapa subsp. trilocularis TaxID=1813537 RepID=A0ABQ7M4Z2_BRACM|nr:hypothetical protein IGI04_023820 [Brassica rapa subsp. trilocularis]